MLALFNLLPAFPLDGGRVLRAYLWGRNADFMQATKTATAMGIAFAYLIIGMGLLGVFMGALVPGLWQVFIGIFLLAAARGTYQQEVIRAALGDKTVAAMMSQDPATTGPTATLSDVVNQVMLRHKVSFIPVVEARKLLGYVDADVLSKIDREHWSSTQVGDLIGVITLPDLLGYLSILQQLHADAPEPFHASWP